jgi:hypothetical protein
VSETRRVAGAVATVTLGLVVALGVRPVATERIVAGYVLALAAVALAALTRLARGPEQRPVSAFEHALRVRDDRPARPPELVRAERELTLGMAGASHAHRRLLPILRAAAAVRLAANRSIDLQRDPRAARAALGDEAWELLRPDRPEPADRNAPGLPLARVESLVTTIEEL